MSIQISKRSEVPLREQIAEQVIYQIVTGKWKAGAPLPSVRELARRLGIHHNTVSEAYSSLVERGWLVRRRGSRLHVRSAENAAAVRAGDLNGMVDALIHYARQQNWTMQELRVRVLQRLAAAPSDHVLLVESEPGLRALLQAELQAALSVPVKACSLDELKEQAGRLIGAQVAAPNYLAKALAPLLAASRPLVELRFGTIDPAREKMRGLDKPSIIAIVSVSPAIVLMARGLFGPAEQQGHTLATYLFPLDHSSGLGAADLVFCDAIAMKKVRSRRATEFHLISSDSIESLAAALK